MQTHQPAGLDQEREQPAASTAVDDTTTEPTPAATEPVTGTLGENGANPAPVETAGADAPAASAGVPAEPMVIGAITGAVVAETPDAGDLANPTIDAAIGNDATAAAVVADPAATDAAALFEAAPVTAAEPPADVAEWVAANEGDTEPAAPAAAWQDDAPVVTAATLTETAEVAPIDDRAAQTTAVEANSAIVPAAEAEPAESPPPSGESAPTDAGEPVDDGRSEAPPADGSEHPLFAEVAAAPHKVYLLGRVRKAIAAAGEGELVERLKALEAEVLAQVEHRKAAKEALCERAEGLKDSTAWKATGDAYKALFEEWKQVGAAGRELDDQLWTRFNEARGAFNNRRSKHFEEREQVWGANKEAKEALVAEAEALQDSTEWKATAEKIRGLQERWKAAGSAGRERDEALWGRFNAAKQVFFDRRTIAWDENRARKEALVADAEALKDSTDWRTTGDAMKVMQAEWKNVGPAGREHEDALWTRFRAATQTFFDRRGSTFAERTKNERDNVSKKQEIIQRAEALVYSGDSLAAAREAKELQAQWKETGPVPREQSDALWTRFRGACDKIFENASGERDRQQTEWHTRMREAMTRKREQLNALRESIAHDEANIARWRESLSTLKPGGKAEEIGKGLEDKIIDVMDRIRDKQARLEDLRSSINDIEAKLKE